MSSSNLTTNQLAERWNIRPATLRQWRWIKQGPEHFRLAGKVQYKVEVIERFEEEALREHTTIADSISESFLYAEIKSPDQEENLTTEERNEIRSDLKGDSFKK